MDQQSMAAAWREDQEEAQSEEEQEAQKRRERRESQLPASLVTPLVPGLLLPEEDKNMTTNNDPFDVATTAAPAPRTYYGEVQIDAWFCVLTKGIGKQAYDETQHKPKDRCTAIDVSLISLPEQNVNYPIERKMIAESREWAGVVWASLKALGLTNVRDANGAWAKMEQVPSGRKYRNKSGDEVDATTFKFLALYPDEAACRAAYIVEVEGEPAEEAAPTSVPVADAAHDLDIATPFIEAFAKQNAGDLDKTKTACASQTIITNAIDVESPEFAAIVAAAA